MYYIYTIILIYLTVIIVIEFFKESNRKNQIAMAMVLLVFILRLLQIK
jgi:RsiW-degrading membrane proteinase PrsW (M82 family)